MEDVLIILEMFKTVGKMGDGFENCVLGLLASILPNENLIAQKLQQTTQSNYFFQQTIKSGHSKFNKMRVYQIKACRNGCVAFINAQANSLLCPICEQLNAIHVNETIYYFPLFDRLCGVIKFDLKRFLNYPNIRPQPADGYLEDIYDGTYWKWFEGQMAPGEVFIGLNFCWDGADMFEFSGKSIWPLSVSILNFPKDLRDKLNIGLHVVAMCAGKLPFYCCAM